MSKPKVSILIPVYNVAPWLERCLDSVLKQTMPDWEAIAVNDASTDNSAEILYRYAQKDPRIKVVEHEKNGGILSARITGIRHAAAPYATFLDSDDLLAPDAMKQALEKAEKTGADIIHFSSRILDESNTLSRKIRSQAEQKLKPYHSPITGRDIFDLAFRKCAYRWSIWGKLYSTELCRKAADQLPPGYYQMAEDFCFYSLLAFNASRYEPLEYPGYVYFMNAGMSAYLQTDLAGFRKKFTIFTAIRGVRVFLENAGVYDEYKDAFQYQEQVMLSDIVHRWAKNLVAESRASAFRELFANYDAEALFHALSSFIADKKETVPGLLTGKITCIESRLTQCTTPFLNVPRSTVPAERWQEWHSLLSDKPGTIVLLPVDQQCDRTCLLWDVIAIRAQSCGVVCQLRGAYNDLLCDGNLAGFVELDHILREADGIVVSDPDSLFWYQKRGFTTAEYKNEKLTPLSGFDPECTIPESLFDSLDQAQQKIAPYYIEPGADGEDFVPFFRKQLRLFNLIPGKLRKKLMGFIRWSYQIVTRKS